MLIIFVFLFSSLFVQPTSQPLPAHPHAKVSHVSLHSRTAPTIPIEFQRIHACEENTRGWHVYPWGGLGQAPSAWYEFGHRFAPVASGATIAQQVYVYSLREAKYHYGLTHQNYPRSC